MGTVPRVENGSVQETVLNYYSQIEKVGEGDLRFFRDAVLAYCASLKEKEEFHFSGPAEARKLLAWLGIRF